MIGFSIEQIARVTCGVVASGRRAYAVLGRMAGIIALGTQRLTAEEATS